MVINFRLSSQKNAYWLILMNSGNSNKQMTKDLHVPLDKEIVVKLNRLKEYHGIKNNTEIILFLITKEFREIE